MSCLRITNRGALALRAGKIGLWVPVFLSLGLMLVVVFFILRRQASAERIPNGYSDKQLDEISRLDVPATITTKKGEGIVIIKGSKSDVDAAVAEIDKQLDPATSK
jgi:hypothetical protein